MEFSQFYFHSSKLHYQTFHYLTFLFIGLDITYLFKLYHGIPTYHYIPTFLCLLLNLVFFCLGIFLHKLHLNSITINSSIKDKSAIILTFAALIINLKLFWEPLLIDFPNTSLIGPILLYFGALLPIFTFTALIDQAIHWTLVTIYSIFTHIATHTLASEMIIVYSLGAIALIICADSYQELQKSSPKQFKPPSVSLLYKLFGLLLENTEDVYAIINKELDIVLASKAFTKSFNVSPQFISSLSSKNALETITEVGCRKRVIELIHNKTIDSMNLIQKDLTHEDSMENLAEILLRNSEIMKAQGFGWDRFHKIPEIFQTNAILQAKPVQLQLSFLEDDREDFLLVKLLNSNTSNKQAPTEKSSSMTVKEIASIVHDLRTPLNGSIFLLQQAVESGGIISEVKENLLEPSLESSKRLSYIINDILDFAQILEGKFRLSFEAFDLEKVLKNPLQIIRTLAKSKGISVNIKIDHDVPKMITSDQNRLVQIIYNLLGNALKFTKEGSIDVYVSRSEIKLRHIEFSVKDTGYGIKPEDLCKLFKTFEKLDNWHDNTVGTGLGLSISNAIAKTLGDETGISVQSEYTKGSTFSFSIEDKTPIEVRTHSRKSSTFAPTQTSPEKQSYDNLPEIKRQEKKNGEGSLRENVLKKQSLNGPFRKGPLPSLDSSEVIMDFICHQNPTVHFDFNNQSLQFREQNQGSKRQRSSMHDWKSSESRYPKESDLYVEKFRRSTLQPEKSSRSLITSPVCNCYQVIAVDDEPMNLLALKLMCFDLGIKLICFGSGDEVINHFKKEQRSKCLKCSEPLFILMDCYMPEKDGFATAKELHALMQSGKMPQIPIYACTADNSQALKDSIVERGMNGYFPKPIEKEKLQSLIKSHNKGKK